MQLEDSLVFGGRPLDLLDVRVEMIVPSNANNGELINTNRKRKVLDLTSEIKL